MSSLHASIKIWVANQDIKYVVCVHLHIAHTSDSLLWVQAKSEILCTDTEEHFSIQPDSMSVQKLQVDSVSERETERERETESFFVC